MGMVRACTHVNRHSAGKKMSVFQLMSFLKENLVESKHHKLARSLRSGPSDHDLKPNAATRDQLNVRNQQSFVLSSIHKRNGRNKRLLESCITYICCASVA